MEEQFLPNTRRLSLHQWIDLARRFLEEGETAPSTIANTCHAEGLSASQIMIVFRGATGASYAEMEPFKEWWGPQGVTDEAAFDARAAEVISHSQPQPRRTRAPEARWCLVGNIIQRRAAGPGGQRVEHGTKHFPPGAKVYCLPCAGGNGYNRVAVIGHHRGSHRLCTNITEWHYVTNWRAKQVYSPQVCRRIDKFVEKFGGYDWSSRRDIEEWLPAIREREQAWNLEHPLPTDPQSNST